MTAHKSTYSGTLVLPNGTEIKPGDTHDISADLAKNAGVASWIENGWLVPVKVTMPGGKK